MGKQRENNADYAVQEKNIEQHVAYKKSPSETNFAM